MTDMIKNLCQSFNLFLLIVFLSSCSTEDNKNSPLITVFSGNAMTMDYKMIIGKQLADEETEKVKLLILQTFKEVNDIYNIYNPESEVSLINRMPAHEKRGVSVELENLFEITQQIYDLSGGRFDPTIEPLHHLWKERLAGRNPPSQEEIEALMPAVGWNKIHLKNGYISKDHDLTSLDFGGIGKAYAWICLQKQSMELDTPMFLLNGVERTVHGTTS